MHASGNAPFICFDGEHQTADRLLHLLKQEQSALVDGDVDRLTTLTEEKAGLATEMARLARERHALLKAAGFDGSEDGMKSWLDSGKASAVEVDAWNKLRETVLAASELNRVNGVLIGQHMARNQTALNILQGDSDNIYGPNGQSANKIGSRRLVVG